MKTRKKVLLSLFILFSLTGFSRKPRDVHMKTGETMVFICHGTEIVFLDDDIYYEHGQAHYALKGRCQYGAD